MVLLFCMYVVMVSCVCCILRCVILVWVLVRNNSSVCFVVLSRLMVYVSWCSMVVVVLVW